MIKVDAYIAKDGRVFMSEGECFHYERYTMEVDSNGEPVRRIQVGESLV